VRRKCASSEKLRLGVFRLRDSPKRRSGATVVASGRIRVHPHPSADGAVFVNDFWSAREWDGFASEMARVVPDRTWLDLNTDHPVFSCVFDLRKPMHELRVPTMQSWNQDFDASDPQSLPHRVFRGEGSELMHVRPLHDDKGRIMILAIHNSDVSDGWEREAEDDAYFSRYSEKIAYPLGINIIFNLMTH